MKMRLLILTALVGVLVFGLTLAPTVSAQSATATVTANANLRAGPGTNFAKVGSASAGSMVTLAGCTAAGDWCRLTDGTWVFAELLDGVPAGLPEVEDVTGVTPAPTRTAGGLLPTATPGRAAAGATPAPTAPATSGPVATGNANLRSGPGTGFERVGSVAAGQALEIVGKTAAGDWYQLADGAWIAAFLVSGEVGDVAVVEVAATPNPTPASSGGVPTVVPLQPEPVQMIGPSVVAIGQEIEGNGWRFKVTEVHKRKAVYFYGRSYVAMGHFLVVILEGVNLQSGTDYFFRNIEPYVVDDAGKGYVHSTTGTIYAAWQYEGLATIATNVNPGNFVRIATAYDLPDNLGHVMLSTDIPKWIDLGDFASMPVEE
jgi:uncharacterized protein YraI